MLMTGVECADGFDFSSEAGVRPSDAKAPSMRSRAVLRTGCRPGTASGTTRGMEAMLIQPSATDAAA